MNRTQRILLGIVLALGLAAAPAAAQGSTVDRGGTDTVPACGVLCPDGIGFATLSLDLDDDYPPCRPHC